MLGYDEYLKIIIALVAILNPLGVVPVFISLTTDVEENEKLPIIEPHISKTGINIFTRLMGLLLAAIAIEFIANGMKGLFPSLL